MTNPTPSDSPPASPSEEAAASLGDWACGRAPKGSWARLALHAAALALVWRTAQSAAGVGLPGMGADAARRLADRFEESRRSGEFRIALRQVRRLLKSFPDRPEYLQAEAELLSQLGDHKGSAASWEAYMEVAPFPADACPAIGQAYESADLPKMMVDAFRRCYEADPSKPDLMLYYAQALAKQERYAEAEPLLRKIIQLWPGYVDALAVLGRIDIDRGRLPEAEKTVAEALAKGPRNPDVYFTAHLLAKAKGDRKAAKEFLRAGIAVSPAYADLHRNLARLLDDDGERDEALKAYQGLLEAAPGDRQALSRIRELEKR